MCREEAGNGHSFTIAGGCPIGCIDQNNSIKTLLDLHSKHMHHKTVNQYDRMTWLSSVWLHHAWGACTHSKADHFKNWWSSRQDSEFSKSELCDENQALVGKPQEIRWEHYHLNGIDPRWIYSWILINSGCDRDIAEHKQGSWIFVLALRCIIRRFKRKNLKRIT